MNTSKYLQNTIFYHNRTKNHRYESQINYNRSKTALIYLTNNLKNIYLISIFANLSYLIKIRINK